MPLSTPVCPWGGLRAEEEQEPALAPRGASSAGSVRKGVVMLGRPSERMWSPLNSEQMLPWSPRWGPEGPLQGLLGVVSSREEV